MDRTPVRTSRKISFAMMLALIVVLAVQIARDGLPWQVAGVFIAIAALLALRDLAVMVGRLPERRTADDPAPGA
jgi:hypothetical protein